ncbi:MAG: VWA domain-containing protein [Lentisphaerae bacterium]|nr:VWA domain-containing protein [Lentisphaerota bacterium]
MKDEQTMETACLTDYRQLAVNQDHVLTLLVRVKSPGLSSAKRKPANLGLAIDSSTSMHGEKLLRTKETIKQIIRHLASSDTLSLVAYSDVARIICEREPVLDRNALNRRVDQIECSGGTNLSAGWLKAIDLVRVGAAGYPINRVYLLTDGMANRGICDNSLLYRIGEAARKEGIATTTFGFGRDFNEDLLSTIAARADGRFYFIESADAMPAKFMEELEGLLSLCAQNIEVRVAPAAGARIREQLTPHVTRPDGGAAIYQVGDAYASEERLLVLRLDVDSVRQHGPAEVCAVEARYSEITDDAVASRVDRLPVAVTFAGQDGRSEKTPHAFVMACVGRQMSARARRQAIELADRGDRAKARTVLDEAIRQLLDMEIPTDETLRREIRSLQEYADMLNAPPVDYAVQRKRMREADHFSTTMRIELPGVSLEDRGRRRPWPKREDDPDAPPYSGG